MIDQIFGEIFVGLIPRIPSWPLTLGNSLIYTHVVNFSTKPELTFSSEMSCANGNARHMWAAGSALLRVFGRISHADDSQSRPAQRRSMWSSSVAASVE
jgi:hypothetical protein